MQGPTILPIDLTAIIAVIMGVSVILIPVIGITARFALKPTVEALGRFFERKGSDETVAILERRVALLEQQLENLDTSVQRLAEVTDFHARLQAPGEGARPGGRPSEGEGARRPPPGPPAP